MVDFDFDSAAEPAEPSCTFTLGGREWACRSRDDLPLHVFDRFTAGSENGVQVSVGPFFEAVIVPEQRVDFMAMMRRPDSPLTIAVAPRLMETLVEQIMARPTRPRSLSSETSASGGRRSAAGSSSPATRRARSA